MHIKLTPPQIQIRLFRIIYLVEGNFVLQYTLDAEGLLSVN